MEGKTFKQLFFLSLLLFLILLIGLILFLIYGVECESSKNIDSNKPLIQGLNKKFNFCYQSEIIIGENSLVCNHPKTPYRIDCDTISCNFQFLNGSNINPP